MRSMSCLGSQFQRFSQNRFFSIICGILLGFFLVGGFVLLGFLEKAVSEPLTFIEVQFNHYQVDLTSLKSGEYFISLGRPRMACEISIGSKIIDSSVTSNFGIRSKLMLGGSFTYVRGSPDKTLDVRCNTINDTFSNFANPPIIAPYFLGRFIHSVREILVTQVGPLSCLLLLFCSLIDYGTNIGGVSLARRFIVFSVFSFFYTLSLSYWLNIFFVSSGFYALHPFLRTLYSLTLTYLCLGFLRRPGRLIYSLHFSLLLIFLIVLLIHPLHVFKVYKFFYPFFIFSTAYCAFYFFIENQRLSHRLILEILLVAATITQIRDFILIDRQAFFIQPFIFTMLVGAMTYFGYKEKIRSAKENERIKQGAESDKKLFKLAAQVAHDIRSPIGALKVIQKSSIFFPSEEKQILNLAVERVEEIASNLLKQYSSNYSKDKSNKPDVFPVALIINDVIKEINYSQKNRVAIDFKLNDNNVSLCSLLIKGELKRALSNIINNSIDALKDNLSELTIIISLNEIDNKNLEIKIMDNGPGFSSDFLSHLNRGEFKGSSKVDGHGLGLQQVWDTVQLFGGNVKFVNLPKGAEVRIYLPKVLPPDRVQRELTNRETIRSLNF